ncbi:MAG TPA: AAA domain-containing protein, partial [Firmicutes bacterium]|nr:AAA domain-containing protein [Bacillota bacterium]
MRLEPRQVVAELDRFIVGQAAAKKALAIALRNRVRRSQLPPEQQAEISPKNIMLIGPTGVGKTELARRLAALVNAPFVKVEATKYTEVGYVGRDVESMVRDLVDNAVRSVKKEKSQEVASKAEVRVEERILAAMVPSRAATSNPFEALLGMRDVKQPEDSEENASRKAQKEDLRRRLRAGELEDLLIDIEVSERPTAMFDMFANSGMGDLANGMQEMLGNLLPQKKKRRKVTVQQARALFLQEEIDNLLDAEEIARLAIERTEQMGIIFIDEIDKVAGKH